jgi:hypothetical protein
MRHALDAAMQTKGIMPSGESRRGLSAGRRRRSPLRLALLRRYCVCVRGAAPSVHRFVNGERNRNERVGIVGC